MPDAFDEVALMDRVDGDVEFLEETIAMLDEDSPALLEQIRTAAASGRQVTTAASLFLQSGHASWHAPRVLWRGARPITLNRAGQIVSYDSMTGSPGSLWQLPGEHAAHRPSCP